MGQNPGIQANRAGINNMKTNITLTLAGSMFMILFMVAIVW